MFLFENNANWFGKATKINEDFLSSIEDNPLLNKEQEKEYIHKPTEPNLTNSDDKFSPEAENETFKDVCKRFDAYLNTLPDSEEKKLLKEKYLRYKDFFSERAIEKLKNEELSKNEITRNEALQDLNSKFEKNKRDYIDNNKELLSSNPTEYTDGLSKLEKDHNDDIDGLNIKYDNIDNSIENKYGILLNRLIDHNNLKKSPDYDPHKDDYDRQYAKQLSQLLFNAEESSNKEEWFKNTELGKKHDTRKKIVFSSDKSETSDATYGEDVTKSESSDDSATTKSETSDTTATYGEDTIGFDSFDPSIDELLGSFPDASSEGSLIRSIYQKLLNSDDNISEDELESSNEALQKISSMTGFGGKAKFNTIVNLCFDEIKSYINASDQHEKEKSRENAIKLIGKITNRAYTFSQNLKYGLSKSSSDEYNPTKPTSTSYNKNSAIMTIAELLPILTRLNNVNTYSKNSSYSYGKDLVDAKEILKDVLNYDVTDLSFIANNGKSEEVPDAELSNDYNKVLMTSNEVKPWIENVISDKALSDDMFPDTKRNKDGSIDKSSLVLTLKFLIYLADNDQNIFDNKIKDISYSEKHNKFGIDVKSKELHDTIELADARTRANGAHILLRYSGDKFWFTNNNGNLLYGKTFNYYKNPNVIDNRYDIESAELPWFTFMNNLLVIKTTLEKHAYYYVINPYGDIKAKYKDAWYNKVFNSVTGQDLDDKWSIINSDGKIVLDDKSIKSIDSEKSVSGKDKNGKDIASDTVIPVEMESGNGYISFNNTSTADTKYKIIPGDYSESSVVISSDRLKVAKKSGKYGYSYDGGKTFIIEPKYKSATEFHAGIAIVDDGINKSYINSSGEIQLDNDYINILNFNEENIISVSFYDNTDGFVTAQAVTPEEGKLTIVDETEYPDMIGLNDKDFITTDDGNVAFIIFDTEKISYTESKKIYGLCQFNYATNKFEDLIPCEYDVIKISSSKDKKYATKDGRKYEITPDLKIGSEIVAKTKTKK